MSCSNPPTNFSRKPRISVRQVWRRTKPTPKSPPSSPLLHPRVNPQSPSPPSHNPLRDQMINQLHNISSILESQTQNSSNAHSLASPSPPSPLIRPPANAQNEDLMFDTGVLDDDEVFVDVASSEKNEQSTKIDDSTASEAEPSEFRVPQETKPSSSKDKGKGIMIEPEVPLKRKDQIALNEQITRDIQAKLGAELLEEQKLARKQEEEANIALIESWENTQAMMEADSLLAERLQPKERKELTDEEKAKLFMELVEKRRKHFAALRSQEKRNRPPTKA
ncbi:hypothetical protein Tco_0149781 [Tanacetum coccineum]